MWLQLFSSPPQKPILINLRLDLLRQDLQSRPQITDKTIVLLIIRLVVHLALVVATLKMFADVVQACVYVAVWLGVVVFPELFAGI